VTLCLSVVAFPAAYEFEWGQVGDPTGSKLRPTRSTLFDRRPACGDVQDNCRLQIHAAFDNLRAHHAPSHRCSGHLTAYRRAGPFGLRGDSCFFRSTCLLQKRWSAHVLRAAQSDPHEGWKTCAICGLPICWQDQSGNSGPTRRTLTNDRVLSGSRSQGRYHRRLPGFGSGFPVENFKRGPPPVPS